MPESLTTERPQPTSDLFDFQIDRPVINEWKSTLPSRIVVASMACGTCPTYGGKSEQSVLSNFTGRDIEYYGIDHNGVSLAEAKQNEKDGKYSASSPFNITTTFIEADLTNPMALGTLPKADVVLFRHPAMMDKLKFDETPHEEWQHILKNSFEVLSPNGLVIMTFFYNQEVGIAARMIEKEGLKIIEKNSNNKGRGGMPDAGLIIASR